MRVWKRWKLKVDGTNYSVFAVHLARASNRREKDIVFIGELISVQASVECRLTELSPVKF